MRFSVIIPLYNGAKFIAKTLDSVLAQTYKDFEIVLVNDASPDNVGEVVKEYIEKHKDINFVYIEQENKGLGGARNTAIRNSSGEIIALIDQDDLWYPTKLEVIDKTFKENPEIDVVSHDYLNVREDGKEWLTKNGPASPDMFRSLLFNGNCLGTPSTSFKKVVVDKVGYFVEDKKNMHFSEDYEMWIKMAKNGMKFFFITDVLAKYMHHSQNFSSSDSKALIKIIESTLYTINHFYRHMNGKSPIDRFRFRRILAKFNFLTAKRLFFEYKDRQSGLRYFLQSLLDDPLYIFEYIVWIPVKLFLKIRE